MFLAGIIPGLLILGILSVYCGGWSVVKKTETTPFDLGVFLKTLMGSEVGTPSAVYCISWYSIGHRYTRRSGRANGYLCLYRGNGDPPFDFVENVTAYRQGEYFTCRRDPHYSRYRFRVDQLPHHA